MSCQIEEVEADSTTWSLADGVLVDDVIEDGLIQLDYISSITLDGKDVEFNWDNGRYMPLIIDDDDDPDSDATIEVGECGANGTQWRVFWIFECHISAV
ncbi:hypothetical protein JTB14_014220 [Gonioctena quinquepunctata]|nr:hypothetical protein JTB14_014220 [Gonioctena quinquepunctata]